MTTILFTIFPVFGLILLGVFLRKIGFMNPEMENAINRLCYWVCLPVFITWRMATAPAIDDRALQSILALFLVTAGMVILGALVSRLLRLPPASRGTFLQAVFRGNLAYVGIPVIVFALRDQGETHQAAGESLAVLTMAPIVLLYNLLGVMALEWDRRHLSTHHPVKVWAKSTLRNPLILAALLGIVWNFARIPTPSLIERMATPIGAAAFPLALLAIGARIASLPWKHAGRGVAGVCLIKNFLAIPLALGVCHLLGVDQLTRQVILVLSTVPTAVASYVLVDQLDGDRDLGAATIAATTLASVLSLSAALWLA